MAMAIRLAVGLQGADPVAQFGGAFVIFRGDGLAQLFLQVLELLLAGDSQLQSGRDFPDMLVAFVHAFDQAAQSFGKGVIAAGAAEPAGFFEVGLGEAADRAFGDAAPAFDLLGGAEAEQEIRQGEAGGIGHAFLLRARFAQVYLLHFAVDNLREEDRGLVLFANVASHTSGNRGPVAGGNFADSGDVAKFSPPIIV